MDGVQTTNKASRKLAVIEEIVGGDEKESDDQKFIPLPTGVSFPLPPNISRETVRSGERSQRVKLEQWNGKVPYDTTGLCFFFRNLLQWGLKNQPVKVIENRAVFDDHNVRLDEALAAEHPEFKVCPNPAHARLWEFRSCVGVGTLNAQMETHDCNICPTNAGLNDLFLRAAKELIESVKSSAEAREKFQAARKRFLKLYYEGDSTSVVTSAARGDMHKAFFAYSAWMWEIAEAYRQHGGGSEEVWESFGDYIIDFELMRERKGPYMFCQKHEAVGDAVPWMRKEDYKDCMICMSKERRDQDIAANSSCMKKVGTGSGNNQLLLDVGERPVDE